MAMYCITPTKVVLAPAEQPVCCKFIVSYSRLVFSGRYFIAVVPLFKEAHSGKLHARVYRPALRRFLGAEVDLPRRACVRV